MNGKRPLCFGRFGPPSHKSYNPKCTIFKTQCAWATTLSTVNHFCFVFSICFMDAFCYSLLALLAIGWLNWKLNGKQPLCFGRFGPLSHKSYNPKWIIFKTQCSWATTLSRVIFILFFFSTQLASGTPLVTLYLPFNKRVTQLKN